MPFKNGTETSNIWAERIDLGKWLSHVLPPPSACVSPAGGDVSNGWLLPSPRGLYSALPKGTAIPSLHPSLHSWAILMPKTTAKQEGRTNRNSIRKLPRLYQCYQNHRSCFAGQLKALNSRPQALRIKSYKITLGRDIYFQGKCAA